ncbi:MAG: DUF4160 domain-containing protein [Bacteroidales bacterium]|nr:DUF4160 domain-containing protein [Candidatus Sodaliphilus fimicaballi]
MGKIFEYFGFIFYFFSNEHEPVHVHVRRGSEECIFDLIIVDGKLVKLERREKPGTDSMNTQDAADAAEFINYYWKDIVDKWVDCFVYNKAVKNTKINKRINKGREE